jgi:hypothetical protein
MFILILTERVILVLSFSRGRERWREVNSTLTIPVAHG